LKLGIKCFIALAVALMASLSVSASDTTTKFKTGPFTVSVDLGMQCNDINISKPAPNELLSGDSYTSYSATGCNALIEFIRLDTLPNWSADFPTDSVRSELLKRGADKDTISLYDRTIDDKSGAVGSGYLPKSEKNLYIAGFYVSPKSVCWIHIYSNETKMISALKTIHVTEAAT
jgi:hypothetical protein